MTLCAGYAKLDVNHITSHIYEAFCWLHFCPHRSQLLSQMVKNKARVENNKKKRMCVVHLEAIRCNKRSMGKNKGARLEHASVQHLKNPSHHTVDHSRSPFALIIWKNA